MTSTTVKVVFGGFPIGPPKYFPDEESIEKEWLGKTAAGKRFVIDTKTPGGFVPGSSTGEAIPQHAKESVELLGIDKVDVYYIHAPDLSIELEDQLKGINEAYKAGRFKRFGLSNFKPADVQRVYDIAKKKGYPLPTVHQASYSPVALKQEIELVPLLRKLGIAFYVYGSIAGGLLTKTSEQLREGSADAGRFAKGSMMETLYCGLFDKPSFYTALDLWGEAAEAAGCSKAELTYRWVAFGSAVDAKYGWLKAGSVGEAAKAKIDEIWKVVEDEAPVDNYNK
ncbi:NADP-dependent oxidoreductase domain-containing protein [Mycena capillaripes]|nr:NADP-dependent oxidoreductase domain-containing protein [Mycena capillaripes]